MRNNHSLHKKIEQWFINSGLTQKQLSEITGINQGNISRIINGTFKKANSDSILRICKYAKIDINEPLHKSPCENDKITQAIKEVWDGSDESAHKIAKYLLALKGIL